MHAGSEGVGRGSVTEALTARRGAAGEAMRVERRAVRASMVASVSGRRLVCGKEDGRGREGSQRSGRSDPREGQRHSDSDWTGRHGRQSPRRWDQARSVVRLGFNVSPSSRRSLSSHAAALAARDSPLLAIFRSTMAVQHPQPDSLATRLCARLVRPSVPTLHWLTLPRPTVRAHLGCSTLPSRAPSATSCWAVRSRITCFAQTARLTLAPRSCRSDLACPAFRPNRSHPPPPV